MIGCSGHHGENQFDTNPAEATANPGDLTRGNSETNEEAAARAGNGVNHKPDEAHPSVNALAENRIDLTHDFTSKAADASLTEIRLGELASQKSSNKSVKDFAQMMINDHTAANDELKEFAAKKALSIPVECKNCDDTYKDLNALASKEFDVQYVDKMIADHEAAITLFTNESTKGTEPELKEWATDKLPVLEHHLYMAKELRSKIGTGKSTAAASNKKPAGTSQPVQPATTPTEEPTEATTTTIVEEPALTKKELKKKKKGEKKERKKTGE